MSAKLPVHPSAAPPNLVDDADRQHVAAALASVQAACVSDPVLSKHLRVAVDPRDPLHWFVHFHSLEAAPYRDFVGGIYGHFQFCAVLRTKKHASMFPNETQAFGVLTPTAIFNSYYKGGFGTGGKELGITGMCGPFSDEEIFKLSMADSYEGAPIQIGATYQVGVKATAFGADRGRAPTTVTVIDAHTLLVQSQMYGQYILPRFKGSILTWMRCLVLMFNHNQSPGGDGPFVANEGMKAVWWKAAWGLGAMKPKDLSLISQAAAQSAQWAHAAYGGQLRSLFGPMQVPPVPSASSSSVPADSDVKTKTEAAAKTDAKTTVKAETTSVKQEPPSPPDYKARQERKRGRDPPPAATPTPPARPTGQGLVKRRVRIYHEADERWYAGAVKSFGRTRGHNVVYDRVPGEDDDSEYVHLDETDRQWELLA